MAHQQPSHQHVQKIEGQDKFQVQSDVCLKIKDNPNEDTYYRKNKERLAKRRLELYYKKKYGVEPNEIPNCREGQKIKRQLVSEHKKLKALITKCEHLNRIICDANQAF